MRKLAGVAVCVAGALSLAAPARAETKYAKGRWTPSLLQKATGFTWLGRECSPSATAVSDLLLSVCPEAGIRGSIGLWGVRLEGGPLDGVAVDIDAVTGKDGRVATLLVDRSGHAQGPPRGQVARGREVTEKQLTDAAQVLHRALGGLFLKNEVGDEVTVGHYGSTTVPRAHVSLDPAASRLVSIRYVDLEGPMPAGFAKLKASHAMKLLGGPDIPIGASVKDVLAIAKGLPWNRVELRLETCPIVPELVPGDAPCTISLTAVEAYDGVLFRKRQIELLVRGPDLQAMEDRVLKQFDAKKEEPIDLGDKKTWVLGPWGRMTPDGGARERLDFGVSVPEMGDMELHFTWTHRLLVGDAKPAPEKTPPSRGQAN